MNKAERAVRDLQEDLTNKGLISKICGERRTTKANSPDGKTGKT